MILCIMVIEYFCIEHEPPEMKLYPITQRDIIKEQVKNSNKKYNISHRKQNYESRKIYQELYPERYRKSLRKFWKTEKGKILAAKQYHKRKTKYGFNILFENIIDEPICWHHVDDNNVIAIPRDIHDSTIKKPTWKHRENLKPIIEQLYFNLD
jgi:hypothetical protein